MFDKIGVNRSVWMRVPIHLVVLVGLLAVLGAALLIMLSLLSVERELRVTERPAEVEPKTSEVVVIPPEEPKGPASQPIKGYPEAPVVIVEFAEFYCPFCARYLWETYPRIYEEYIAKGLVRYEFRNLIVHGPVALLAAAAGECAHRQARFWQFHDRLFEAVFPGRNPYSHEELDVEDLEALAEEAGLEMESFSSCLEGYHRQYEGCRKAYDGCVGGGKAQAECAEKLNSCLSKSEIFQEVMADREELIRLIEALPEEERAARIGTPTFFINGRLLVGARPFADFKRIIEEELERWEER